MKSFVRSMDSWTILRWGREGERGGERGRDGERWGAMDNPAVVESWTAAEEPQGA